MAYSESPTRANIEFLRSNQKNQGRVIRLNHTPQQVPPQLAGRVDPATWHVFMTEVETLANQHPYVIPPKAGQYGKWACCAAIGSVVGFCMINPDGGDYGVWNGQAQGLVQRWRQPFQERGCQMTFVFNRNPYIQIDVDPNAPVVGAPMPLPTAKAGAPYGGGKDKAGAPYGGGEPEGKPGPYVPPGKV